MREIWKPVPGYEKHYEVSNLGNARRIGDGKNTYHHRPLKPHVARHGYKRFALSVSREREGVKHWSCHRMVWEAFNGPIPDRVQINHKNGVVDDNRLVNLELATPSENKLHSIYTLGRKPKPHPPGSSAGAKNGRSKLTEADIPKIRTLLGAGFTIGQIANIYAVSSGSIWFIQHNKTWKHVGNQSVT